MKFLKYVIGGAMFGGGLVLLDVDLMALGFIKSVLGVVLVVFGLQTIPDLTLPRRTKV